MSTYFATPGQELTGNVGADQDAQFQAALAAALKEQELAEATRTGTGTTGITEADLQAVLAKLQGAQPAQPAAPPKIKLFGQEYDTPEAAEAAIQNALVQAKQSAAPAPTPTTPQGFSEEEFKKFLDRPNGTPEALDYALRHTPLFKELEHLRATTAALKMADTARQVKELVPGFQPKNPQEVATLTNIVNQLGMAPDNPAAWEAAIALADRRGLIKLEQPKPQTSTRPATPPPFFGAGSEAPSPQDEEVLRQLWGLSDERVEQLYNSQRR